MKVAIVGAGVAGSFAAFLLARKSFDVVVFEKSKKQKKLCGGVVTHKISMVHKIFRSKNFADCVVDKIKKYEFSASTAKAEVGLKKPDLVLNRKKFDSWLRQIAKQHGAKFVFQKVISIYSNKHKVIVCTKKKNYFFDIVVGADGACSTVARTFCKPVKIAFVAQVECSRKKARLEQQTCKILLHEPFLPFFAWQIPVAEKARVGCGITKHKTACLSWLKKFSKKIAAAALPVGKPTICRKKNIFLIGDSACYCKQTTGGGIIPSLLSAKALAESISCCDSINKVRKTFQKKTKALRRELLLHYKARKLMNLFGEKAWNFIVRSLNNTSIQALAAETISSRDFIVKTNIQKIGKLFYLAKKVK